MKVIFRYKERKRKFVKEKEKEKEKEIAQVEFKIIEKQLKWYTFTEILVG
jgi:hypothetical protein